MTNRTNVTGDDEDGTSAEPLRPIPDGGLGSSMPDWLRQPPAWKRTASAQVKRTIPPPDASVIDPRAMIDIDDLPAWLQAVAGRKTGPGLAADDHAPEIDSRNALNDLINDESVTVVRAREAPPQVAGTDSTHSLGEAESAKPAWWMSDGVIGGLLVAIILTMLYVVLIAAGVI